MIKKLEFHSLCPKKYFILTVSLLINQKKFWDRVNSKDSKIIIIYIPADSNNLF